MYIVLLFLIFYFLMYLKNTTFTEKQMLNSIKKQKNKNKEVLDENPHLSEKTIKYVEIFAIVFTSMEMIFLLMATMQINIIEIYLLTGIFLIYFSHGIRQIIKNGITKSAENIKFNKIEKFLSIFFTIIYRPIIIVALFFVLSNNIK